MNCAFSLLQVLCGRKPALTLSILSAFALSGCSSFSEFDNGSVASMTQAVPEFGRRSLNTVTRSVPELGMLTDKGTSGRSITIRLSDQRAFLYKRGEVVAISPASTGREGYNTPIGRHRVIAKDIDHRSSIYGAYVRNGQVVKAGVDVRKDPKPPGAVFVGAPMPVLSSDRAFIRVACRPRSRISGFSRMHQVAGSLGKTLLLRRESRHACADLPLAGEFTPEPAFACGI